MLNQPLKGECVSQLIHRLQCHLVGADGCAVGCLSFHTSMFQDRSDLECTGLEVGIGQQPFVPIATRSEWQRRDAVEHVYRGAWPTVLIVIAEANAPWIAGVAEHARPLHARFVIACHAARAGALTWRIEASGRRVVSPKRIGHAAVQRSEVFPVRDGVVRS